MSNPQTIEGGIFFLRYSPQFTKKLFAVCLVIFPCIAMAQFGPVNFIFQSEVTYPNFLVAGDVDMDGDADVIIKNNTPDGVLLYNNLGGGVFDEPEIIYNVYYNFQGVDRSKIVDIDNDGDGDLVHLANWFRNNGAGQLFTYMGAYAPAGVAGSGLLSDLDGDGDLDDIGTVAGNSVLLLNNGSGTFTVGASLDTMGFSTTIFTALADVNGDQIDDLVIGGNNSQVGWYPGLGNGLFGAKDTIQYLSPAAPDLGDVDGDGDNDLIAFGAAPGVRWWSNNGSGVFTLMDTISASTERPAVVGDIDGDGDIDYTVSTGTSCDVVIMKNDNGNSWAQFYVEAFSGYNLVGTSYATGDLDGDGYQDLLFCHGLGMAAWYPNEGNGQIGQRRPLAEVMSGGREIAAADVDLDGDLDVAAASFYGDFVSLYIKDSDSTFADQVLIAEHCNKVSRLTFVDLNVDGKPDIITNVAGCAVIWNNGSSWTVDTLPGQLIASEVLDADGDLDMDLICDGQWLQNDGTGNFTSIIDADITAISPSTSVVKADLNGDGIQDVASGVYNMLTLTLSNGPGDFTSTVMSASASSLAVDDMDNDGDTDIVAGGYTDMFVLTNDGGGSFTSALAFHGPQGSITNILGYDFDDDGDEDIIWSLSNGYIHQLYLNRNIGNGQLGPYELIDPAAEVTYGMIMMDANSDAVPDLLCSRFHSITWRENMYFNAFRLRGSVFKDFNIDGMLDPAEEKVPFQLVRSDANNILVWTNSIGEFDLAADSGTFNVWTVPPSIYQVTNNPDSISATLSLLQPIQEDINFGMAPYAQDSSALFSLNTSGALTRCNTSTVIWVNAQNTGTFIPENAVVDVMIHPDLTVDAFSMQPDSTVGDHYFWHIDSLGWFQQWGVSIQITTGPVGSSSNIDALLTWGVTDTVSRSIGGLVTCALDPNDKLVTPTGYGAAGAVDLNIDWLTYVVRFQNTGNDTAFTVVIADTLDADLNWASMQILATSHSLTGITVDETGRAAFRFDQILLPDSNIDEPGSHGFIMYRIAPASNATDLSEIENTAAIYFDLNAPVITNTVLNTLVDCSLFAAEITSNGVDSLTATQGDAYQWFINGDSIAGANSQTLVIDSVGNYSVVVTNNFGCIAMSNVFNPACDSFDVEITFNGNDTIMSTPGAIYQWFFNGDSIVGATSQWIPPYVTGTYAVAVIDSFGCSAVDSLFIVISNIESSFKSAYSIRPNPSNGTFTLSYPEECDALELTDLSGRILQTFNGRKKTWYVATSLEAGVYVIRIIDHGKQIGVARLVVE